MPRFWRPTQHPPLDGQAIPLLRRQPTTWRAGVCPMEDTSGPPLAGDNWGCSRELVCRIDSHLICGISYHHLVGTSRYSSLLVLDSPEYPLPLSEIIVLYNDMQIHIRCGQCPLKSWWSYYSAGIVAGNKTPGSRPLSAMSMRGGIQGIIPTLSPVWSLWLSQRLSRRRSKRLIVVMVIMASPNPLPQRQSRGLRERPRPSSAEGWSQDPATVARCPARFLCHSCKAGGPLDGSNSPYYEGLYSDSGTR